jgi:hypothetical protein
MEVWAHKTSLTWHFFLLKCLYQDKKENSVLVVSIWTLSTIFLFDFGTFFSILLLPEILIQYSYSI